ncbi:MAG: hypothetical protein WDO14_11005 [Bacteroidota bacterium]
MKKFFVFVGCLGLLSSCNKDNDGPSSVTALTVTIEAGVDRAGNDDWFIVRNHATGEVIDYKNVKPGESVKFETNKTLDDNKIDVTWLAVDEYTVDGTAGKQRSCSAPTYLGIEAGGEIKLKAVPESTGGSTQPTIVGHYKILISHLPTDYSISLSDKYGLLGDYGVAEYPGDYYLSGDNIDIRNDASTHMISVNTHSGDPKYLMLENLKDLDKVNKDYSDFKSFDKIVQFKLPDAYEIEAFVTGFDGPVGGGSLSLSSYALTNSLPYLNNDSYNAPRSSINLGFLNKFPNYVIELNANGFDYVSKGPAPTAINYTDPSVFSINDKSLTHFAASSSQSYLYRTVYYGYSEKNELGGNTYMSVSFISGAEGAAHYQPFPQELLTKFSINPDKIQYSEASFVIKGESFSDHVDYVLFNGNNPPAPYEKITLTVH